MESARAKETTMTPQEEQFLQVIRTNDTNQAKLLIEKGINVNLIDAVSNMSVLMLAAQKHNYKLCELLLGYGADLFWKNQEGETIFDKFKNDIKLMTWLETQIKRINNQKFKEAALQGNLNYITEHFSEVNADTLSWSFVHAPSVPVLDYLLKMGIDVNVQSTYIKKYGFGGGREHYTLTSLLDGCKQNNLEKVKFLLEHGARVDIVYHSVRLIYGKDSDDYINEDQKITALSFARTCKNLEMVELLKSYGAKE